MSDVNDSSTPAESSDKPGAYPPDPFGYADDFGVGASTSVPPESRKDRSRRLLASRPIVRWAARQGLVLYAGAPGCKYPLKDFFEDGKWTFRSWTGTGPALARIPPDMAVLDGDTDEGRAAVAAMDLPPHFAIRSKTSGGEKRFFRCENPPKRMIRALPGLDVLTNPGNKSIWCKIDDGSGDGGYEIISDSEDCPDLPPEVLAALAEAKSSGAILRGSGSRPHRTRQVSPSARWDDDNELLPTEHYAEHGIPLGLQEDRLYRLANRFAAQGMSKAKGTRLLLDIASECEQDDRNPWNREQLMTKMDRAADWVATLPPEKSNGGGGADDDITDSHLAEQFAGEILRDRYCWVAGWGWMAYRGARNRERGGTRWFRTDDKEMTGLARTWLLSAYEAFLGDKPDPGAKKVWRAQLSERHVRAVVSLAACITYIKRDIAEFDAHPDLLNCANCVVDLRTGAKTDHDPALMFTKTTGVDYVPGAAHPDWSKALTALPARVRPWYQVRIGQAATGYVPPDEALLMNIGDGENGKTTCVQGFRHALGDYYAQVPLKALMGDSREHDTVLMGFKGARLAALEETPEESRLNMQQVKQVSTPQITGRYMRQDYVTYDTTHATVINTNHEPAVEAADHGSLRRVLAVRWPYRYLKPGRRRVLPTDRKGDPGLRDRMIAGQQGQHEAVLAWMVAGAVKWYAAGRVFPAVPKQVQADTAAWLGRVNLIFAFGTRYLAEGGPRRVMSAELWRFFSQSIKEGGHNRWSEATFNRRLREFAAAQGWVIEKKKTKHSKNLLSQPPVDFPVDPPESYQAWHGLRFKDDSDEEVSP